MLPDEANIGYVLYDSTAVACLLWREGGGGGGQGGKDTDEAEDADTDTYLVYGKYTQVHTEKR